MKSRCVFRLALSTVFLAGFFVKTALKLVEVTEVTLTVSEEPPESTSRLERREPTYELSSTSGWRSPSASPAPGRSYGPPPRQ